MLRIVLTNDDGIEAPGLQALLRATEGLGERIVIAPAEPQSGVGHQVTTLSPIRVREVRPETYAVAGTPADCARIALTRLVPDADWLLSGVNHGGNLGADFYTSGTVAAAREAALLGCPAIALSQYVVRDRELRWETTAWRARGVLKRLLEEHTSNDAYYNVNLPHPEDDDEECEQLVCPLDPSPQDVRFREEEGGFLYEGYYHLRPRLPGHDVDVCFSGKVAVTRIPIALGPGF